MVVGEVVLVDAIPMERSGIERDVPKHMKLVWRDSRGRRCSKELPDDFMKFVEEATVEGE